MLTCMHAVFWSGLANILAQFGQITDIEVSMEKGGLVDNDIDVYAYAQNHTHMLALMYAISLHALAQYLAK